MKDVFYTLVIIWIVWRILNGISVHRSKQAGPKPPPAKKDGKTTVEFVPPKHKMKNPGDVEGDYVDFEEMK